MYKPWPVIEMPAICSKSQAPCLGDKFSSSNLTEALKSFSIFQSRFSSLSGSRLDQMLRPAGLGQGSSAA